MYHSDSATLQVHGLEGRLKKEDSITKHYDNPAKKLVTDITSTLTSLIKRLWQNQ